MYKVNTRFDIHEANRRRHKFDNARSEDSQEDRTTTEPFTTSDEEVQTPDIFVPKVHINSRKSQKKLDRGDPGPLAERNANKNREIPTKTQETGTHPLVGTKRDDFRVKENPMRKNELMYDNEVKTKNNMGIKPKSIIKPMFSYPRPISPTKSDKNYRKAVESDVELSAFGKKRRTVKSKEQNYEYEVYNYNQNHEMMKTKQFSTNVNNTDENIAKRNKIATGFRMNNAVRRSKKFSHDLNNNYDSKIPYEGQVNKHNNGMQRKMKHKERKQMHQNAFENIIKNTVERTKMQLNIPAIEGKRIKKPRNVTVNRLCRFNCKEKNDVVAQNNESQKKNLTSTQPSVPKREKSDYIPDAKTPLSEPIGLTGVAKWAPNCVNDATKPYYEAWVDTKLCSRNRSESTSIQGYPGETFEDNDWVRFDLNDEKYMGTLRIRKRKDTE